MREMEQEVEWARDCEEVPCKEEGGSSHTMAVFAHRQSLSLREVEFDPEECRLIFYKALRQLDRLHAKGIIHKDIKLGNILLQATT